MAAGEVKAHVKVKIMGVTLVLVSHESVVHHECWYS